MELQFALEASVKRWALAFLLTGGVTLARGACAEPGEEPDAKDDENVPQRWYGWQTLAADTIPTALFLATIPASNDGVWWTAGAVTFAFSGPIVHGVHDRPIAAAGSLGLRVGLPVLGMLMGVPLSKCYGHSASAGAGVDISPSCEDNTIMIGALLGLGVASVADAAFLAYEPSERPQSAQRAPRLQLVPSVVVRRDRGAVMLTGVF